MTALARFIFTIELESKHGLLDNYPTIRNLVRVWNPAWQRDFFLTLLKLFDVKECLSTRLCYVTEASYEGRDQDYLSLMQK